MTYLQAGLFSILFVYYVNCACGPECKDPETGRDYPVGMTWTSRTHCDLQECVKYDDGTTVIIERPCPKFETAGGNCPMSPMDLTKDYPDCCPQPMCQ